MTAKKKGKKTARKSSAVSAVGLARRARAKEVPPPPPPGNREAKSKKRERGAMLLMLAAHGHRPPQIRQILNIDTHLYNRYVARIRLNFGTGGIYDHSHDVDMERIRMAHTQAFLFRAMSAPGLSAMDAAMLAKAKVEAQKFEHVFATTLGLRQPVRNTDPRTEMLDRLQALTPAERETMRAQLEADMFARMKSAAPRQIEDGARKA